MNFIGFKQICQLAGGIVLFLYGLRLASDNLKVVAGARLKVVIKLLTSNRFLGLFAGIFGTILVQSNTATAVILVGLCQAGVITLGRSIGVLLGANLGSTVTVQFIAFDLYAYALLFVALGFLCTTRVNNSWLRGVSVVTTIAGLFLALDGHIESGVSLFLSGTLLLALTYVAERSAAGFAMMGFGLIFVGMRVIKIAMALLKDDPSFSQTIIQFQSHPILVIIASFIFTVLTNSSTATLGTAIALVASGGAKLISPVGSVAIVLGAHLGSCPMAVLSSTGTTRIARQVSFAHVFIKVAGVLTVYPFLAQFSFYLTQFNNWLGASPERAVANAHSLFNIVNVLTIIPFTTQVAAFLERMLPERKPGQVGILQHFGTEHMEFQPLAIESAELEVKRLAFLVRNMIRELKTGLGAGSSEDLDKLQKLDDEIDALFRSILSFLTDLGKERLGQNIFQRVMTLVYVVTNLEGIGDRMSKDFVAIQKRRLARDVQFSFEGLKMLSEIQALLLERIDSLISTLVEGDSTHLKSVIDGRETFLARIRVLKKAHFKQLIRGVHEASSTTMIVFDTLAVMINIHQLLFNIAENLRYCPWYGETTSEKSSVQMEDSPEKEEQ